MENITTTNQMQSSSATPFQKVDGSEYIAAIDLGTTKVVTIVGRRASGKKIQIVASSEIESQGIFRGEVLNITQVVEAMQSTLDDVRQKVGTNITDVYVGIAGQHIRCIDSRWDTHRTDGDNEITTHEIQEMEDKMYEMRVNPGEKILHVIPQNYNVDDHYGVNNPVGMLGKELSANYRIFIGKMQSAEYSNRCITRVGLNLKKLILEPLASAQAVLSEEEKEVGVAMVDIGGGTTDLAIYYDGIVRHSAVIPFGGNSISEDIRQGCGILPRQANGIKIQYGSCYSDLVDDTMLVIQSVNGCEPREVSFKFLAEIIEARMSEILDAVMYEIARAGYDAGKLPAGIVFTGGGAMIQHLKEFVATKTGMEARVVRPTINITSDSPKEVRQCSYATAIGLLLKGMEYEDAVIAPQIVEEQPIDKIPEVVIDDVKEKGLFGWITKQPKEKKTPKIKRTQEKKKENVENTDNGGEEEKEKIKRHPIRDLFEPITNPDRFYDNAV
jgi:cell division protein FtsA